MASDYRDYEPMLLERAGREQLKSAAYRRFILAAGVTPGVRLLLARQRGRPDWPFVDTKFNPNTGRDLGPESYGVVFGWFLGRGGRGARRPPGLAGAPGGSVRGRAGRGGRAFPPAGGEPGRGDQPVPGEQRRAGAVSTGFVDAGRR